MTLTLPHGVAGLSRWLFTYYLAKFSRLVWGGQYQLPRKVSCEMAVNPASAQQPSWAELVSAAYVPVSLAREPGFVLPAAHALRPGPRNRSSLLSPENV